MGHPCRHSAPALNSDDRGFDHRYLTAGEVAGDGEGTIMFPTSRRVGWWYYLNQVWLGPSSASAMAARPSCARRRRGIQATRVR